MVKDQAEKIIIKRMLSIIYSVDNKERVTNN